MQHGPLRSTQAVNWVEPTDHDSRTSGLLKLFDIVPERLNQSIKLLSKEPDFRARDDAHYTTFVGLNQRPTGIAAVDAAVDLNHVDLPAAMNARYIRDMASEMLHLEGISHESNFISDSKFSRIAKSEHVTASKFWLAKPQERHVVLIAGRFVTDGGYARQTIETNAGVISHLIESNYSDIEFGTTENMAVRDETTFNQESGASGHPLTASFQAHLGDSRSRSGEYVLS